MKLRRLQYGITLSALLIAVAHLVWPKLTIDTITVTLLFIALVPWLAPLFKSLELPGGWKIEFQDFERAGVKAGKVGLLARVTVAKLQKRYSFQSVAKEDPKFALIGLRIEIQKRLTEIAESEGLETKKLGISQLLRILSERKFLTQEQSSVISDIVRLLNEVAYSGDIDKRTGEWALDVGPRLLDALETKIKNGR